ncbi:MAG: FtsK/SpoIIIE domain-containing protein [Planctomycetia bacterium]|nr:FtsK/SpoIIIE domain-containing protein [Planctomycetia bacterium]
MAHINQQQTTAATGISAKNAGVVSVRDRQRAILRNIMTLTTQCVDTEEQIERQFAQADALADKQWEIEKTEIAGRYASQLEQYTREHQHSLDKIAADYESGCARCGDDYTQAQAGIKWEFDAAEKKTRDQIAEAKWMAEGEVETARNQIRAQNEELSKVLDAHAAALTEIERSAVAALARCFRKPPLLAALQNRKESADVVPDYATLMATQLAESQKHLKHLRRLLLPKLVFGAAPWIFLALLGVSAAGIVYGWSGGAVANMKIMGLTVVGTWISALILGLLLRIVGKTQFLEVYQPLLENIAAAREAARQHAENMTKRQDAYFAQIKAKVSDELQELKKKAMVAATAMTTQRDLRQAEAQSTYTLHKAALESERDTALAVAERQWATRRETLIQAKNTDLAVAQEKYVQQRQENQRRHDEALQALQNRLRELMVHTPDVQTAAVDGNSTTVAGQADLRWANWTPSKIFPPMVRFGEFHIDLRHIIPAGHTGSTVQLQLPPAFAVPATLAFPYGASLLAQYKDRTGREKALRMLQAVMLRLLMDLPPGRVWFTIIDPQGLGQNFAGFMRLADHDERLVGGRIWTRSEQIEQRLSDLTEHMETVIQKYLRNEFATIDDYNAQAGELAEPYRFVVVADFPTGFERDSFRRLASIAATGARCGVYILVAGDLDVSSNAVGNMEDIAAYCVNIMASDAFAWRDEVFGQFSLALDTPPPEEVLTPLLDKIGRVAKTSQNVEVPFDIIAPSAEEFWTRDSTAELSVPIGRMGATRLQMLRLGRAMAQHGLLAGKTGSGKSTLLHAIITNLAIWYSPDQVELYLIDFKKGVEFKTYATHGLPHARAIAVESDREFGLSVLERLDVELTRRGELFRKAAVQDLPAYRIAANREILPRILLVIDEFQEFFSADDKLAQQAGMLLDRLVRQGRAFGIHLLLGSQTIGGTSGLARSTIGQMAVRIALQVSEADSQIILGDNNSAARLLSRPGAAIYNDAGGLVEANSPFQVAWLPDEKRDHYLEQISRRSALAAVQREPPVIFEGNAPADVGTNKHLAALLQSSTPVVAPTAVQAWIGEPVAIKEPTVLTLRRQSGSNVLLVGQQEEQSLSVMVWALVSMAAQYPSTGAKFHIMDGTAADSRLAGMFARLTPVLRHEINIVEWRVIPETIHSLTEELRRRLSEEPVGFPEIFLFIYGLQRYRMLRKSDDDFSFSLSGGDAAKAANPAKEFSELLRDGPGVGIHIVAWVDTLASLERTIERSAQREFDNRVLFQMSASDSSSLIDSPAANNLGFYRAMACSEERGVMEKFRPYALPSSQWIQDHQIR